MRLRSVLGAAVSAALVLTMLSCTGNSPPSPPFNTADVTFAQAMIRLDRRTLELTSLVGERSADLQLQDVAARISEQHHDDVDQMTSWLTAWDRAVPDPTGPDEFDDPHHRGVTTSEVDRLRTLRGAEFDRMLATLLTRQLRAGVDAGRLHVGEGYSTPAVRLAAAIVDERSKDVAALDGWVRP